eukprot:CAMPEP_0185022944 /NCGR_PEP_ID=MMETSP1103-20130426/5650_1 /TAXON_ID=36769 /ORGANISM="Paraphysomonas bandaiensis, Strain Caron Lab Isolate" /LENGTH=719 /DNA_ID=CAMNT_0027555273 /DNA_START=206 /DNA_END=2365 /DNA_ORIENTATION=+
MNGSWPVKYLFQERQKSELAKFIEEINYEHAEHMSFQKDFNESIELKPTYEQLSQDRIVDQSNKNILMVKSFEHILDERLQAFSKFLDSLGKARSSFDSFQESEGTIRQALDALFVFVEQELQQARQQLSLGDLKRFLADVKVDAQKRASDFQREIAAAESDVNTAEKALMKSKESLQKLQLQQRRMETGENPSNPVSKLSSYRFGTSAPSSPNTVSTSAPTQAAPSEDRSEKCKETDELILRQEREVRECVRDLLNAMAFRDQVLAASRRAFQRLNKECKEAIGNTLRKLVDREREALAARQVVVDKLDAAVERLSVEDDEAEFIRSYSEDEKGELVLCSQALSILDVHVLDKQNQELAADIPSFSMGKPLPGPQPAPAEFPMEESIEPPSVPIRSTSPSLCSMEETTMHLSKIFFLAEWPAEIPKDATPAQIVGMHADKDINHDNIQSSGSSSDGSQENNQRPATRKSFSASEELKYAMSRLIAMSSTLDGRKLLVNVLNQFRSKKVDVGIGFKLLGAVLWSLLNKCRTSNDVHNGKIVMILSQTFYRVVEVESNSQRRNKSTDENQGGCEGNGDRDEAAAEALDSETQESDNSRRESDGEGRRQYLKEIVIAHPIWQEGRFWEQALWQCVLEQLQMIQYGVAWHDLPTNSDRMEAVCRVHDVIFSQVMAIAHSMMELGCPQSSTREFVYRMCVIHQLSERQRQQLLAHLSRHDRTD